MAQTKQIAGDGALRVHLVTPSGKVAELATDAVTAPGELGEFEVLPGHIPFVTEMHPGVLILGESRGRQIFAVGRGYLRVDQAGGIEILVERAIPAAKVNTTEAEADKTAASKELNTWTEAQDAAWRNLKNRLDWANARLDAHKLA
ncbi:MAG TPA: ATP synthase F1 subunit epsilon [Kofleriaceae bacterium]|nr:ATP synthase F1 subunit epsilon [Kofleriaceae bacterium]